jgi:hypothetical protein
LKLNPSALGDAVSVGVIEYVGVVATQLTVYVTVPEFLFVESIFLYCTEKTASLSSATVTIAVAVAVFPLEYVPFIT